MVQQDFLETASDAQCMAGLQSAGQRDLSTANDVGFWVLGLKNGGCICWYDNGPGSVATDELGRGNDC